jgi:hypothetical protein
MKTYQIELKRITTETHPELFRAMDEAAQEFWAYPDTEWQDAFIDAWLAAINLDMTTYTYEKVTLNGKKGWIATRRIEGVHAGKQFGKTKKAAREAFND